MDHAHIAPNPEIDHQLNVEAGDPSGTAPPADLTDAAEGDCEVAARVAALLAELPDEIRAGQWFPDGERASPSRHSVGPDGPPQDSPASGAASAPPTEMPPIHPALTEYFPAHSEQEIEEAADDLRRRGQEHPCVVWNGHLIDGRRTWICGSDPGGAPSPAATVSQPVAVGTALHRL